MGIRRVLKPGGKLFSSNTSSPLNLPFSGGKGGPSPFFDGPLKAVTAHATFLFLIGQGGFGIEKMDSGYVAPFPKSGSYCWSGVAVPALRPKNETASPVPSLRLDGNTCPVRRNERIKSSNSGSGQKFQRRAIAAVALVSFAARSLMTARLHANSNITMNIYTQQQEAAQSRVVEMILPEQSQPAASAGVA